MLRLSGNDLWTEFPYSPEYLKAIGEGAQKKVGETSARGSVKSSVKSSVKTPDRILALLETNPEWSLADVAEALEMTVRGIEKATAKLVEKNKLKYIEPQKGRHWEVLK